MVVEVAEADIVTEFSADCVVDELCEPTFVADASAEVLSDRVAAALSDAHEGEPVCVAADDTVGPEVVDAEADMDTVDESTGDAVSKIEGEWVAVACGDDEDVGLDDTLGVVDGLALVEAECEREPCGCDTDAAEDEEGERVESDAEAADENEADDVGLWESVALLEAETDEEKENSTVDRGVTDDDRLAMADVEVLGEYVCVLVEAAETVPAAEVEWLGLVLTVAQLDEELDAVRLARAVCDSTIVPEIVGDEEAEEDAHELETGDAEVLNEAKDADDVTVAVKVAVGIAVADSPLALWEGVADVDPDRAGDDEPDALIEAD